MIPEGMDQSLLQEFLTEAGELIESLDADLVELEGDPRSSALLDSIFRALHTIKGAASFLALTNLIEFAHAAEDALNRMRKGEIQVDQSVIDVMLRSVDVIRAQLADIGEGNQPRKGPEPLLGSLRALASGKSATPPAGGKTDATRGLPAETANASATGPLGASTRGIQLPPEKLDVLPFMASDLRDSLKAYATIVSSIRPDAPRGGLSDALLEPIASMRIVAEFFEFVPIAELLAIAQTGAEAAERCAPELLPHLSARLSAIACLLDHTATAIEAGSMLEWPIDGLRQTVEGISAGTPPGPDSPCDPSDPVAVLAFDGVCDQPSGSMPSPAAGSDSAGTAAAGSDEADDEQGRKRSSERGGGAAEQTVRVEVERLEALMNLVGEMVLAKNQVLGLSRQLASMQLSQDAHESIRATASDLDRLTSELQMAVMRTRMQPLSKLFGKYPRLIRDLARKTAKKLELVTVGGETEVDKSVLEMLGDPLVHILRNSVDHGMELPADRVKAGKPECGTVTVAAEHQGGHVCVRIIDDGRGIDPKRIAAKAIEKGMATPEQIATMSDRDIYKFIFAAGFSTAEQVSDLSGRGVGMDVVRTNVTKLGGEIQVESSVGVGTTIQIMIPLTVAILPAMMVGVGRGEYAIPIASIHEIVGLRDADIGSISKNPVMRLREDVVPLVDLRTLLGEPAGQIRAGFAVIVQVGQERAGMMVDRLIGQREVVIKPLEDAYTVGGPFSGATIREDGDVSLILDVVQVVRVSQAACGNTARRQSAPAAALAR